MDVQSESGNRDAVAHILSAWKRVASTRFLVCLFVGTSLVDIIFTYLLVDRMGTLGEANLVIRWLFELNLLPIWACMALLASFLCGVILGSGCIVLRSKARIISAVLFSMAISTRVGTNFYMAALYLGFEQPARLLLPIGLTVFVLTLNALSRTRRFEYATDMEVTMKTPRRERRTRQIMKTVGAIILIPLVTLGFLQILTIFSGIEKLPRWLRSLGIVTELQGRLFLVGLVAIVVMIAAMIYAVVTLFELLGRREEPLQIDDK